jgi:hypothetical protein
MPILAQFHTEIMVKKCFEVLLTVFRQTSAPMYGVYSIRNYTSLMESLSDAIRALSLQLLREEIETLDRGFLSSPNRTRRYHVKTTRERTLITPVGVLTFTRTIYQNTATHKCYCHVDRILGLPKYDRYDPCVKAMIVEAGASINSMIKVGEFVGDRIFSAFSLAKTRKAFRISRQTVHNVMKRAKQCIVYPAQIQTPPQLYLMADEKFIPLQSHPAQKSRPAKQMVKMISVFEGIDASKSRHQLLNKVSIAVSEGYCWEIVHDFLNARYDLDKVEQLHILGDGAAWILSGVNALKTDKTKTDFSLDLFHAMQAVNRITRDEALTKILRSYIHHDARSDFFTAVALLKETNPERHDQIEAQESYLYNHWMALQNTVRKTRMGCSMEGEIAHTLASQFSSVAKAYSSKNLPTYVNYRLNAINGLDVRNLYIEALDSPEKDIVEFKPSYDFSIFDLHSTIYEKSSHSRWLKGFIAQQ